MFAQLGHSAPLISRSSRASAHAIAGEAALDRWISQKKVITLSETLHTDHISDLYITLPTRDGTIRPYVGPKNSETLGFGHHLAFFHPRMPERHLRADGTETDFCPPEPFVRRMWAGGRIEWRKPLIMGGKACARTNVSSVHKKGFEGVAPMVFVNQRIEITNEGEEESAVLEERSHVYLALGTYRRTAREVHGLPLPDFSLKFTPSPTTLFRFSALTFNGHRIHLDRDYARESEGYPGMTISRVSWALFVRSLGVPKIPERLVHGPLTALMLLETLAYHRPEVQMKRFEYRALNPVVVNRELTFHGSDSGSNGFVLWVQDEDGVVGMKGLVSL